MNGFSSSFTYGKLTLPSNVFYSPLAGCSNLPFRQMSARYGAPGMQYCEMVKMQALARLDPTTLQILDYTPDIHPIGAQLVGADPKLAGPCAAILEDMGFDAIDLNCGCPVDKVTQDGSGSGLLHKPHLIGEILCEMVSHVKIPVSVKIRAGWDEERILAPFITQLAEQAGAVAITIHGRTREQAYRGKANWDYIRQCKEVARSILVIGNGDVFDPIAAKDLWDQTGCDAIMASRGTMGAPWLAADIAHYCTTGHLPSPRSFIEVLSALKEHYELAKEYLPQRKAIIEMRKVSGWYLEGWPQAKSARSLLARAQTPEEVNRYLDDLAQAEPLV